MLERDPALVERLQTQLQNEHIYGLISVEQVAAFEALPYTENLVNLVVVQDSVSAGTIAEVHRVLRPRGIVLSVREASSADTLAAVGLRNEDVASVGDQWLGGASPGRRPWTNGRTRVIQLPETRCRKTHLSARHAACVGWRDPGLKWPTWSRPRA